MKNPNTNNKIAFCWHCLGPLTGDELETCNEYCEREHAKQQTARTGETEFVLLNWNMLGLARGERILPHRFSAFIHNGHDMVAVAEFDKGALETITDAQCLDYDAWWRGVGRLNTSFESLSSGERVQGHPHQPRKMREVGIFSYLCDEYGISTERNVAAAIGELAHEEGHADPITLINSL